MADTYTEKEMKKWLSDLCESYNGLFNLEQYKCIDVETRRWEFHNLVVEKFIKEYLPEYKEVIKKSALKIK